ncbi:survival motor neuron protein-like [Labrus mixtus]|uniref:survival motor neuron protein-like n=1 Tax=Labrus mixtus TaxID=508554 RepID=UPI0029BFD4DB|nr:survival motor neuron protein-like [Labrus mixtus]
MCYRLNMLRCVCVCVCVCQWAVGAHCQAVWSEDRQLYPAKVVSLDGERCKVQFSGFGNEEEVELSALKSPDAAVQTQKPDSQDWRPGSRCRAVYSGDGLVYPAVVKWVKGQRCCVRYDEYNNEEEHDVSGLLSVNELHGPGRAAPKGGRRTSTPSRREEKAGERRSAWRDEHIAPWNKDKFGLKAEKDEKKKDAGEKPTNHGFPFFPPQSSSGDSFVPPPPWTFAGKESSGADSASSMLMLWYMCGFHTGSYLTQQACKSSPKD